MTYAEALAQNNQVKKATELIEQFVLNIPMQADPGFYWLALPRPGHGRQSQNPLPRSICEPNRRREHQGDCSLYLW